MEQPQSLANHRSLDDSRRFVRFSPPDRRQPLYRAKHIDRNVTKPPTAVDDLIADFVETNLTRWSEATLERKCRYARLCSRLVGTVPLAKLTLLDFQAFKLSFDEPSAEAKKVGTPGQRALIVSRRFLIQVLQYGVVNNLVSSNVQQIIERGGLNFTS